MKRNSLIFAIFFIVITGFLQRIEAQGVTSTDKEKELRMQEAIRQQKETMRNQQKKVIVEVEKVQSENENNLQKIPEVINNQSDTELNYQSFDGSESSSWEFYKSVRGNSFSMDYAFDVEPIVNRVVLSVDGECKSGEITIKIVMPNGKIYSDINIDESGELNWRKSFTISDYENKDKTGAWKFEIGSLKAIGFFRISLQTY